MAIDPQLEKVVQYMVKTENTISEKLRANGDRPWLDFEPVKSAGKFDFDAIHQIFSRKASNNEYVTKRQDDKSLAKDLQTAKLSADYLAGLERDHRARTRSRVRTFVHAGVVATASNGNAQGPLRRNTLDWLGRILTEDSSEP